MPQLYAPSPAFSGNTSSVDTTAQNPLGTRAFDAGGNEYIYLQGVASVAVGTPVTYDENYLCTLLAANAVGPVAVAMAAVVAARYGWFLVRGSGSAVFAGAAVADAPLYAAAAAFDDAVVVGDLVVGGKVAATVSGAGLGSVQIVYPFVTNALG